MIDPTNSFRIDPVKGTLILTNPAVLDREKNSDVIGNLEVGTLEKAESEIPEERRKAMRGSRVLIRINVIDENDNAPMFVPCESVIIFPPIIASLRRTRDALMNQFWYHFGHFSLLNYCTEGMKSPKKNC